MKGALLAVLLASLCPSSAICQSLQLHPELCGAAGSAISPPPGFSAVVDREKFAVKFFFRDGVATLEAQAFLNEIEEICPLPNGRVVVFGETGGPDAIYIIESGTLR